MKPSDITHRFVLTANLRTTSPLRIANGTGEGSDLVILRRQHATQEPEPYLPASSLAGTIQARWKEDILRAGEATDSLLKANRWFWGTTGPEMSDNTADSFQSHFRIFDMPLEGMQKPLVNRRDGVRIDAVTGTAEDQKKYGYELLEPGALFSFRAEVTVRKSMDVNTICKLLHWLCNTLQDDLRVGSNTTKGFGCIEATDVKCFCFDFSQSDAASHWLSYCSEGKIPASVQPFAFTAAHQVSFSPSGHFTLSASFSIKSSLLIGGGSHDQLDTEKAPLRTAQGPVLSGKSLTGVLRHRARKILLTVGATNADVQLKGLFGDVDEDQKKASRSRLISREASAAGAGTAMKQTRIRVDRFTAAPVQGGLFDSAPLWKTDNGRIQLWWQIRNSKPWEEALLLHLLRDLWTEDLPIGGEKNVGRGLLVGHEATFSKDTGSVTVSRTQQGSASIALTGTGEYQSWMNILNQPLATLIQPATQTTTA